MPFYDGTGENGLAVVFDARSKDCKEYEQVFPNWSLGNRALGRQQWRRTLRIALREHGSVPWNTKRVRDELRDITAEIRRRGIHCVVPVQTANIPGVRQVHSAWNMFGHAGSPYKWGGTVERKDGLYVCPLLNPGNYEYVYGWLFARWLRQAHAVAAGRLAPMPWPHLEYTPDADMLARLDGIIRNGGPVAVDIETDMAGTLISAIGFSDGNSTVSVPWHTYRIAGGYDNEHEAGLETYLYGTRIKEASLALLESAAIEKILHNGAFDVVQLAKHGITLRGFAHDTLLMHRVVYPQFRHGLQQACATEFCVEPWKSLHKPPKPRDGGDVWLSDPVGLRIYNAKDTYATWQLWNHLKGKLG